MLASLLSILVFGFLALTINVASQETTPVPQDPRVFGGPERKLYNGVPPHLPVRLDVKNVESDKWVHDLEVVVTNVSDKPIYFMDMFVFPVGFKSPKGYTIGYWLKYGRARLINFAEPLQPDDVPIKPGEKHIFKISESDAKGWDAFRERENKPEPTKLELAFQRINFGDGTGFGPGGKAMDKHRKVSTLENCLPPPQTRSGPPSVTSTSFLPALLPVKFYADVSLDFFKKPTVPQTNCG